MHPWLSIVVAGFAGIVLGVFYFWGLWLTVRLLPKCRWPVPVLMGSFVLRTAAVLGGFFLVMNGRWERVLACLGGFFLARLAIFSRLRPERLPGTPATTKKASS
jgi:F1F0 ATPase subunit 2